MHLKGRAMDVNTLINDCELNDDLAKIIDRLTVMNLYEIKESMVDSYEQTLDGKFLMVFTEEGLEEDAHQISLRIQALDFILSWLTSDHQPYDFDLIGWWDDEDA